MRGSDGVPHSFSTRWRARRRLIRCLSSVQLRSCSTLARWRANACLAWFCGRSDAGLHTGSVGPGPGRLELWTFDRLILPDRAGRIVNVRCTSRSGHSPATTPRRAKDRKLAFTASSEPEDDRQKTPLSRQPIENRERQQRDQELSVASVSFYEDLLVESRRSRRRHSA